MKLRINRINKAMAYSLLVAGGIAMTGCSTNWNKPVANAAAGSGAKLWADNCIRCHNVRGPNLYSDTQWDIITMQMSLRANLTAQEHREIVAFLKSAH